MTSESDFDEGAEAAQDETKWSFLRRLILAIAAERQKKAAEVVKRADDRGKRSPRCRK
jgi:hypothetical protein